MIFEGGDAHLPLFDLEIQGFRLLLQRSLPLVGGVQVSAFKLSLQSPLLEA